MNPHITTIHFDATTFSADDSLIRLLQAKAHYHELSPNKLHTAIFNNAFYHGGDSSGNGQTKQPHLSNKLLQMLSLAQQHVRPQAFFCIINNKHQYPLLSDVFHDYPMYPFMLTLGQGFERWCHTHKLVSEQYYAHITGMWLLQRCVEKLANVCNLSTYCTIYPGSSNDIPLQVNRELFTLFIRQAQSAGITLNEHCMFWPLHTVAGVILPHSGTNICQHCMLQHCQFRNNLT